MRRARRPYDRQLSKYHAASSYRAIRRSMRVIMMETKFGGGACDCGVVPGLKILSGRRRGAGRPLNFRDEQVASIAEFPFVNQAIWACPARRRRRWARTGVPIPTPGSSITSATAAGHPRSLREGRRCIRPPICRAVITSPGANARRLFLRRCSCRGRRRFHKWKQIMSETIFVLLATFDDPGPTYRNEIWAF